MPYKLKLALFITIIFWASSYVAIRAGLVGYSPGGLALLRYVAASIFLVFVFFRTKKHSRIGLKDMIFIVANGMLGIGIYNVTLNYGEIEVHSGMASFIVSQMPVVATMLAVIFFNEKINRFGLLGLIISILGVALITLGGESHFNFYVSMIYLIVTTILGALYTIFQKPMLKKHNVIDVTTYGIWGATFILLIYAPHLWHEIWTAPFSATVAGIYLGLFPGAIAYLCWSYVLSKIPASKAVSFLYFSPAITTLLGWGILGEIPQLLAVAGGVIALFGVWLIQRSHQSSMPSFEMESSLET